MSDKVDPGLVRLNAGVADAIKAYRYDAGLTQSELATMVGVNQSLISRLERQCCDSYSLSTLFRVFDKMELDIEIRFIEREQVPVDQPLNKVTNG